ncbi:class I SAM-dependent methyltransferase [Haloechinothrix salitolerans]|uniref:Class I SAM-dependent methyltransferase n=1 Tax=Haloechinothrix salitolerans TaxID=926830 RepID=A0ABW2C6A6_9PSEU
MAYQSNAPTVPSDVAATWLRRWDTQQERYIADREERFAVICDIVDTVLADEAEPVVVDLGCGPGSLAARLHERRPAARIIGVDSDPLLLALARSHYGDVADWVDADLAGTTWHDHLPPTIHAAVSTTALHWLAPEQLAKLYRTLGSLITPGGVFVNGDHLGLSDQRMHTLARTLRDRRANRVGVQDNEEWRAWWNTILADQHFADVARDRARRFVPERGTTSEVSDDSHSHGNNGVTLDEHIDLLRNAGFSSVSPLWQIGDDHVLTAVR